MRAVAVLAGVARLADLDLGAVQFRRGVEDKGAGAGAQFQHDSAGTGWPGAGFGGRVHQDGLS